MAESLTLRLLGAPLLENSLGLITLSRRKSIALLAYLALEPSYHARDSLAALLWPEFDRSRSRANLRSCLFEIDHAAGRGALLVVRENVGLAPAALRIDVEHFRALALPCSRHGADLACPECIPRHEAAARLWRDEFMAGFSLPDSRGFDDWQLSWGERLRAEYCVLLERLARGLQDEGRLKEAEDCARRWVEAEPYEEEARRRQILLLLLMGRRAQAIDRFEDWFRISMEELGSPPTLRTRNLVEQFLPKAAAPSSSRLNPASAGHRAGQIGRDSELESLGDALLSPGARLHTIVGVGGLGKTLLARGIFAERCGYFPGGAFFVELAAIRDSGLVPQAVAAALGVTEASRVDSGLEEAIAARVGAARTLIVLDNFEQVVRARSFVSKLMAACPALTVLATSRERLGIDGESVVELQPLGFPTGHARARAADQERYQALKLIALRGAEAVPGFELSDGNAGACASLCAALGGIPLALELAASRFAILDPSELLARLDRRLDLIAAPRGDYPERHRTLRAVIDWSHELLDPQEQGLFALLAVFEGSFDIDAAEEVCGLCGDLVEGLGSLVAKSLLTMCSMLGRTRFSYLESIRDYAAERFSLRPDRAEAGLRHAEHYLARAERLSPALRGSDQREVLRLLDLDQANFQAALDRLIDAGDAAKAYRLCAALEWQWYRSGRFAWGERALKAALALDGGETAKSLRGRCIRAFGWIRFVQGAWREAHASYLEATSTSRDCGDRAGLARCLSDLGVVERWLGNRVAGDARCLEAIVLARECGEALLLAYALIWAYGTTGGKRVDGGQREGLEEAIRLARREGDPWAEAHALGSLGDYLRENGDGIEAEPCFEAALRGFESVGDSWMQAWTLEGLGMNASVLGDPGATERLRESLRLFVDLGDRSDAIYVLGELGLVACAAQDETKGAILLGACSALGMELGLHETDSSSSLAEAVRGASARHPRDWGRGRLMAYDEIVAFALGCNDPATQVAHDGTKEVDHGLRD